MARGEYRKTHYDTAGDPDYVTVYSCVTSGISLQNIIPGEFKFDFLTDASEGGVLGCVNLMMEKLEVYMSNTQSYDVDGKNNYPEAYDELKQDVQQLTGDLERLKNQLEEAVSAIETEIRNYYVWAYKAQLDKHDETV